MKAEKSYVVEELEAPHGYQLMKPVTFTATMEKQQRIIMENSPVSIPDTGDANDLSMWEMSLALSAVLSVIMAVCLRKAEK